MAEDGPVLGQYDDPVVGAVDDKDPTGLVHCNPGRNLKRTLPGGRNAPTEDSSPFIEILPIWWKFLDAIVIGICHVKIAVAVKGNIGGVVELPAPDPPRPTDLKEEASIEG